MKEKKGLIKVFCISDHRKIPGLDRKWLLSHGVEVRRGRSLTDSVMLMKEDNPDLALVDLGEFDPQIEAVELLNACFPGTAVIVFERNPTEPTRLDFIRQGAQDVLSLAEMTPELLLLAIQKAVTRQNWNVLTPESQSLRQEAEGESAACAAKASIKTEREMRRNEAILEATNEMASALLRSDTWQEEILEGMVLLGRAAEACRVSIFSNEEGENGGILSTQVFEWNACDTNHEGNPEARFQIDLATGGFRHWAEILSSRQTLAEKVADLPDPEQKHFLDCGIGSVLVAPIFAEDHFWGFIEIDHDDPFRQWELDDIKGIQTAAGLLGSAIRRQKISETLKVNVQDLNRMIQNFPGVVQRFDRDFRCTFISSILEEQGGASPSSIIGKTVWELDFPQEMIEGWGNNLHEVFENGNPLQVEYRMNSKNGVLHRETRMIPEFLEDGKVGSVLSFSLDISARRYAEESFRTLVENSLQELIILQQGQVVYANPAANHHFGSQEINLQGMTVMEFLEFIHPDDRKPVSALLVNSPASERPVRRVYRQLHPKDHLRWLDMLVSRIEYHGKTATQVAQVDVTAIKSTEEQLKQTLFDLQTITSSISVALWMGELTPEGVVRTLYVSPVIEKVTGHPVEYFLEDAERNWHRLIHPEDQKIEREMAEAALRGDSLFEVEYRINRLDGEIRWVRDSVRISRDAEGKTVLNGVVFDITETRNSQVELQKANEQLSSSVEELALRNLDTSLMNEMGDLLQSCLTLNEVYAVVGNYTQRLLPDHPGTLYIINSGQDAVERVMWWGNNQLSEPNFLIKDCWGLRRGRMHVFRENTGAPLCSHLQSNPESVMVCAPLITRGETLGLLYLECRHAPPYDHCYQLAASIADRAALAVATMRMHEDLRMQSTRDPLTGLFNRRFMDETLERELMAARRHNLTFAVVMADIDHFKLFNDRYGHQAGDVLLQGLSACLTSNMRGEDVVCRYGGEEFVFILPDISLEKAVHRMEDVRMAVNNLAVEYHGQNLDGISLSFGAAVYPLHGTDGPSLLLAADRALYNAKQTGRDRVSAASVRNQ